MRIRYSFRTEKNDIPADDILVATTIKIHGEFVKDHNLAWTRYEEWIKPMNSLEPGIFFSINYDSPPFPFCKTGSKSEDFKIFKLGKNYVKIYFNFPAATPYKIIGY